MASETDCGFPRHILMIRTVERYRNIEESAPKIAERALHRAARSDIGTIRSAKRPMSVHSGAPGGWEMPRVAAAPKNSPQSQNGIEGCMVERYVNAATRKLSAASA